MRWQNRPRIDRKAYTVTENKAIMVTENKKPEDAPIDVDVILNRKKGKR